MICEPGSTSHCVGDPSSGDMNLTYLPYTGATACNLTCVPSLNATAPAAAAASPGLDALSMILLLTYGTIATVGLLGNGLVVFVILKYTKMKTVTNMYILNLSIADSLFLIGLPLIMTTMALRHWVFGFAMCKLYFILTCINMFTGTFTLIAMSADRFLAVVYPFTSISIRTTKYASIGISLIWILSFIFMLPVVLYTQIVPSRGSAGKSSCLLKWPSQFETSGQKIFSIYTMLLGFVIPVFVIILLYTLLVIRLKTTGAGSSKAANARRRSSHRKVTKLVTLIIAIFIICWLPYWVFQVYLIVPRTTGLAPWQVIMYQCCTILSYSNSMINPLLYAFTNENFREAFISAFKCASDPFRGHKHPNREWESVAPAEQLKVTHHVVGGHNGHAPLKVKGGVVDGSTIENGGVTGVTGYSTVDTHVTNGGSNTVTCQPDGDKMQADVAV